MTAVAAEIIKTCRILFPVPVACCDRIAIALLPKRLDQGKTILANASHF
jgi:hypothetical protein